MLGSYRLLILIKLILFELLGLICIEGTAVRRFRRMRPSSSTSTSNQSSNSYIFIVSASVDQYFTVLNCSTPERVPHHKLDWYFQTRASLQPPRVIWQRGRSNIHRYVAYSPDQIRHFLQIKPLHYNDSGTYMCLDQTSGFYTGIELLIHDRRSCAANIHGVQLLTWMYVVAFSLRWFASEVT